MDWLATKPPSAINARDKVDESVRRLCYSWPLKSAFCINCFWHRSQIPLDHENHILKAEYKLRQKEMAQATKENTHSKYVAQRQEAITYRLRVRILNPV